MISEKSGAIISISSMWGIAGGANEAVYSASKAGVIGLSKALAKELAPSGITVNCVAPGVIDTKMNSMHDLDELKNDTPLRKIGTPHDVADAVSYLAFAPFVTGEVLVVDGGFIL